MLKGKTALVTGSTSGIGLGIARALARQGANIVMNGFGDVDGPKAQIEAMVQACEAEFGAVDILVNNAGIQHVASVEEFPVDKWDAIIAINLSSRLARRGRPAWAPSSSAGTKTASAPAEQAGSRGTTCEAISSREARSREGCGNGSL